MKKVFLVLVMLLLVSVSVSWGMAQRPAPDVDAQLAKIEAGLKAENVLPAQDVAKLMLALRAEYEARKDISLVDLDLTPEERMTMMLLEKPIIEAVKIATENQLTIEEQARIAISASIAIARGGKPRQVEKVIRIMSENRITSDVCLQVLGLVWEASAWDPEMTNIVLLLEEMIKLNLKGECLALAIREMILMEEEGKAPAEACRLITERIRGDLERGATEKQITESFRDRIRERERL